MTDIKQQFDDMAHSKHIGISITANADAYEVDIDPNNFDKVIYNVLSNALKFTPDNGSVKIEIFCTPERTNISVADTGIGIDDSQAEKIFNRFYQIESSQSAQYKGTGIGLHLSRSIVDMHGGTITARRRPQGQGSLFCISLPTRHPGATPAPAPEAHAEPLPVEYEELRERLRSATGLKVSLVGSEQKGKIVLEYASQEELQRLWDLMGAQQDSF